jgi:predicted nucleic acid-binding protein
MDTVLLDTDVFSFIFKNDTRAQLYKPHLDNKRVAICFVTVAELYRWAIQRNWSARRVAELRTRLRQYLVIPFDDAMAWEWATVSSIKGHPIASSDAWIAAAALRHGIPLVTHNRKHYLNVPSLTVISES